MNKVILIGNVGFDPELKDLGDGRSVVNVPLATSRKYKNKEGEYNEETEWHRLTFWSPLAEIVDKYVKKGNKICVEGSIKSSKYTNSEGVEASSHSIIVRELELLGSKRDGDGEGDTNTNTDSSLF